MINKKNDQIKFVDIIGYRVFSDDLSRIPIDSPKCKVVNTISPNSYGIATKDNEFESSLKNCDYLVLDGVYFALASILLKGKNIKKNQGPDVFYHFIERSEQLKKKVFFLGSTEKTLDLIRSKAAFMYPNVTVKTYSPPFRQEFTFEDNHSIIEAINSFNPDIVFVGMTCPKQEKWAMKNREEINAHLIITIGNVFDWFAGTQKPIKPIWFKMRIGWLIRIFVRPEVFKRNIGNQMRFFGHIILIFLKLKRI